jgi:bifunctional N-acetylglucosamine-1-phosphate-uridyltransferase/glucosamine-1-phosphate-acetyltransferase GlmU-like protein
MIPICLDSLSGDDVPQDLRADSYFDFDRHPFAHRALFDDSNSVCSAIAGVHDYARQWLQTTITARAGSAHAWENRTNSGVTSVGGYRILVEDGAIFEPACIVGSQNSTDGHTLFVENGASLISAIIYLDKGDIFIGRGTHVEPGAGIRGPTIIGPSSNVRQGAYLRDDCILGSNCTVRGEIKNSVLMDNSNFPHPSYLGDSLCGYNSHFGNQGTSANLGIYAGMQDSGQRKHIIVSCDGKDYDIGRSKMGICLGDYCQVGCNCVSDPGTFLKPYTVAYALSRITKGFYGPHEVLKNKPLEHGVIERAPFRMSGSGS